MSSLLNSVVSMGKAALQRMQAPPDPNQVRPVSPADLAPVPVAERDGCLQLVGPRKLAGTRAPDGTPGPVVVHEVVAHTEKGQSFR